MDNKSKNNRHIWTNRDWAWLCFILVSIVIFLLTFRLSNNGYEIVNIISVGAGISSIILAGVAIIYSIINNNSASDSLSRITEKVSLITEVFRKIDSVEKIVESLKGSSAHADKIQSQTQKSFEDKKELDGEVIPQKGSSDLSGAFVVVHRFTRFHFKLTSNESLDIFQLGEMLDSYFQKAHNVPVEDYSISQNSLQGILLENTTFIDGCIIVKKHFEEGDAQLAFQGVLKRAIISINPNAKLNVVYIHIGHFKC